MLDKFVVWLQKEVVKYYHWSPTPGLTHIHPRTSDYALDDAPAAYFTPGPEHDDLKAHESFLSWRDEIARIHKVPPEHLHLYEAKEHHGELTYDALGLGVSRSLRATKPMAVQQVHPKEINRLLRVAESKTTGNKWW